MSKEKNAVEEMIEEKEVKHEDTKGHKEHKEHATRKTAKKHGALVRYAVMGGIVILANLFVVYALHIAYPEPKYENFCKVEQTRPIIENEGDCLSVGGQWNASMETGVDKVTGYCNQDFSCSQEYSQASALYQRNVFIVFVVIGVALLVGSVFLQGSSLIASSLSFAGILAFIIGSLGYWSNMNDKLRVVILGIALVTLLYLAWKKFED
jgi:hypothetical protein